jgi:hypothetical protein
MLRKLSSQRVCLVFYGHQAQRNYLVDSREEEVVLGLKDVVVPAMNESKLWHALEIVPTALA